MVLNLFKTLGSGKATDSSLPVHRRHQRTVATNRSNVRPSEPSPHRSPERACTGTSPSRRSSRPAPPASQPSSPPTASPPPPPAPSSVAAVLSRLNQHHPLTGTLSAPASPRATSSSIPLKSRLPTGVVVRPPAPNIVVEKGRIEFARAPEPTAPPLSQIEFPAPSSVANNNNGAMKACKMGAKIFRPSPTPGSPRFGVKAPEVASGSSVASPEEAANVPARRREVPAGSFIRAPSPKLDESKLPVSARAKGENLKMIPRPGFIRSRESSPASSTCSNPPLKASSKSVPVPVSPNLVRWRAKLTSNSTTANNNGTKAVKTIKGGGGGMRRQSSASSASSEDRLKVAPEASAAQKADDVTTPADDDNSSSAPAMNDASMTSSGQSDAMSSPMNSDAQPNQMQLLNLHYEVKRLEETVQTLLPLRHQQSALIQSYEERLSEAQSRLANAEAEVGQLKERLARSEAAETEARQLVAQLEAEKSAASAGFEQQRVTFDKCLDEIANHVVQALISQKNLQGECRRLRSQVSDLEQRNVALNLLLTQSLRESMLENNKKPVINEGAMVKSSSYDVSSLMTPANPRDSMCSAVSDSEIRNCASIFEAPTARPLVSKDSNWTLSSSSSSSSASQAALSAQQAHENPVERAEKLLAVLKHRLFSAQLNSYKSIQQRGTSSARHSLVLPDNEEAPARPSTLTFTSPVKEADNNPETPSVRALVQVLEQRVQPMITARPPPVRAVRLPTSELHSDGPASKDEGYSTMSSDVQVDSSSSSSSFIASGCSSPATLRRSAGGSAPASRSLPMAKRKTLLTASSTETRPQPNRSISLQETHSGAGLEELKEEGSDELTNDEGRLGSDESDQANEAPRAASAPSFKREWPAVQLGTLCEDWSPSSAESESSDTEEVATKKSKDANSAQKWTSDSELYKADQEDESPEEHCKTLQLKGKKSLNETKGARHPLRRTRAETQLSNESSHQSPPAKKAPNYSQHEMEDWIMDGEQEPAPSESGESNALHPLPAISEISYESDDEADEEDDEPLFVGECSSPECQTGENGEEEGNEQEESVDTEFTRDYYRLVKFESNRSLANSEKYDHCAPDEASASNLPPPDRQVALQTVLDFIVEQQRYCARRENDDAVSDKTEAVSSLSQLRSLIPDDEEEDDDSSDGEDAFEDGFATKWLPVRSNQAQSIDLTNLEVRAAMLEKLNRSSSSSSCGSNCNPFDDSHCLVYRPDDTAATTNESYC